MTTDTTSPTIRLIDLRSIAIDNDEWRTAIELALMSYRVALDVDDPSSREDDLYHDMIEIAPRVGPLVSRLNAERRKLDETAALALQCLHQPNSLLDEIIAAVDAVIRLDSIHQSHTVNLFHEAYAVDLGGTG